MLKRQMCAPLFIQAGKATPLQRVPFAERFRSEQWLQEQLFAHPRLLPIAELEPVYDGLIPIARELPTDAGPLDLFYINSSGQMTLVETKLWRNPEARRVVVAQLIDYAKAMAQWSYDDLLAAVRSATGSTEPDPLRAAIRCAGEERDEAPFIDTVTRNLRLGRFLLLIVGDGIHEGIEHMTSFLQQTPQLGFSLALVEMAMYRLQEEQSDSLFVQPRVLARTREVTRAVVEVRTKKEEPVVCVALPDEPVPSQSNTESLSEQAFLSELTTLNQPETLSLARRIMKEAPSHQLRLRWNRGSCTMYYRDSESGEEFSMGALTQDGEYMCWALPDKCDRLGLPEKLWRDYYRDVVKLVPGSKFETLPRKNGAYRQLLFGPNDDHLPLNLLAKKQDEWLNAIDRAVSQIGRAIRASGDAHGS